MKKSITYQEMKVHPQQSYNVKTRILEVHYVERKMHTLFLDESERDTIRPAGHLGLSVPVLEEQQAPKPVRVRPNDLRNSTLRTEKTPSWKKLPKTIVTVIQIRQ